MPSFSTPGGSSKPKASHWLVTASIAACAVESSRSRARSQIAVSTLGARPVPPAGARSSQCMASDTSSVEV
jgi:hypothetical protein